MTEDNHIHEKESHHHHHHHHDSAQESVNDDFQLDPAGRSLSEALRLSFVVLKIIMVILVVAFLASGLKTVDTEEQALVLRFGKIRGIGEDRILGPGLKWIFPYPIDEIVKIPVERKENLAIDTFWYYETLRETSVNQDTPLYPLRDGYCLTRGETEGQAITDSEGSDYNIVHTRWQITYQIINPERFFRNIYVRDVEPGEVYSDVIRESVTPLLKSMIEDAVVTAMVNYTIDESISADPRIPRHVLSLLQEKLDSIESGIRILSPVQLTRSEVPRQVKDAFEKATLAVNEKDQLITKARENAETTLSAAAGSVAQSLFNAMKDPNTPEDELEALWDQVSGEAKKRLSDALVYAAKVEEDARANSIYLENILPKYNQWPELVIQQLYLETLKDIIGNAQEKFLIQNGQNAGGTETRVMINRDKTIPRSTGSQETGTE